MFIGVVVIVVIIIINCIIVIIIMVDKAMLLRALPLGLIRGVRSSCREANTNTILYTIYLFRKKEKRKK